MDEEKERPSLELRSHIRSSVSVSVRKHDRLARLSRYVNFHSHTLNIITTTVFDIKEAFCPSHLIDRSVVNFPREWCSRQPTRENG